MRCRVSPVAAYAIQQKAANIAEAISAGECASAFFTEDEADTIVLHFPFLRAINLPIE